MRRPTDPFLRVRTTGPLDLVITLDRDEMIAKVEQIGPEATVEKVERTLFEEGIATGLRHDNIASALRMARETGAPVLGVVVAEGVRPRPGGAARVVVRTPRELDAPRDLGLLADLVERGADVSLRRLGARGDKGWLVRPGDVLSTVVIDGGEPGVDLRGRVRPPPAGPGAVLGPAGPGVERSADGRSLVSRRLGYAGLVGGRLAVVSLVWAAADEQQAGIVRLPLLGSARPPTPGEVEGELARSGITDGIDPEAVAAGVAEWPEETDAEDDAAPVVALALPPAPPVPGEPVYRFDHEFRAATEDEEGRADFKERNVFPPVEAGGLLAVCPPTRPGVPGRTVRGHEVPAQEVPPTEMVAGDNVRRVEEAGEQRLYATSNGGASTQSRIVVSRIGRRARHKVSVRPVAVIRGDVGYSTGHVRFNGNVEVHGSVRAGFDVMANGDITIRGGIEDGARVGAMGGVVVAQGIHGATTRVSGRLGVNARFVQEARVRSGGDIEIRSYAHDAQLEADGEVRVLSKGGRRAGIIGGVAWGAAGVAALHIGSHSNAHTIVVAGVDRGRQIRLEALQMELDRLNRELRKLLKSLGMRTPEDLARIYVDPAGDDPRAPTFGAAQQLMVRGAELRDEREALLKAEKILASQASVTARRTIHAGTRIRVGSFHLTVEQDRNGVCYHLDPTGERRGVLDSPAGSFRR